MSTSSGAFSPLEQHHLLASEQLCYVHCNLCDTVLAVTTNHPLLVLDRFVCVVIILCLFLVFTVLFFCNQVSVPYTSLLQTVTVRCGHCTNLLSVNMRALLFNTPAGQLHLGQYSLLSPNSNHTTSLLVCILYIMHLFHSRFLYFITICMVSS